MVHALVVVSGTGLNGELLFSFPFLSVSEVLQLKRLLINAERAGVTNFTLICEEKNKLSILKLISDERIQSQIDLVTENEKLNLDVEESIVIQSNLVIHYTSIESFINASKNSKSVAVLSDNNKNYYGLLKVKGADVEKIVNSKNLQYWITQKSEKSMNYIEIEEGYYMNLSNDKNSLREAKDLIFSNVGKTATGWIARNINGRISLPISRQLVKTPLTPNIISCLINFIGIFCGLFYALGYPVIGAIFMQIATVLDRCDGEVARVKLMETKKGQWVDTISDQFTVLSFYIGLPIGYYLEVRNPWIIVIGVMNLSLFIFFLVWSFYFLINYTNSGSLVAYFEVDKIVGKENTSVVRRFIAFLRPVGRRNVYSLAFLIMAIVEGYWLVFFFATVAIIFFFLHQLEDIIKISRIKRKTSESLG